MPSNSVYRNKKLLDSAEGQPCVICGSVGTTVAAHANSVAPKLFQAAEIAAPLELCGLLFSEGRFQTCKNVSVDPWGKFEIDHAEFLQHMADYGEAPWGIVHSHPRGSAHLSGDDCLLLDAMQATNVQMLMVIVGLQPQEIRAFTKNGDAYTHVFFHDPQKVVEREVSSWPSR